MNRFVRVRVGGGFWRPLVVLLPLGVFLGLVGCFPNTPRYVLPTELPDAIEAVIAAYEEVEIADDDPLFDQEDGAVVDELSGLAGCWASYRRVVSEGDASTVPVDRYEFFQFDFDANEMAYQFYAEAASTSIASLTAYTGTFTVEGDNRLAMEIATVTVSDPYTGELLTRQVSDDEALEIEFLVTLDGDQAKFVNDSEEDASVSVCVRFDCPS